MRMKSEPARTTELNIEWVNILKVLPFVFYRNGISEPCTILKLGHVPSEYSSSASVQTAHKHVLVVWLLLLWHKRYWFRLCSKTAFAVPAEPWSRRTPVRWPCLRLWPVSLPERKAAAGRLRYPPQRKKRHQLHRGLCHFA